ncbi:MAG: DUF6516 family protein [Anaerolineae bacterium]
MNRFRSLRDYELYVYSLQRSESQITRSTLVVAQRGRLFAELTGDVTFTGGYRLAVYERLTWDANTVIIEAYSYEVWLGGEKLYWYDSQPHPNDPTLASTHPHHKHLPPDIKHHRVPAPGLSFSQPNLPFLIAEILEFLLSAESATRSRSV